MRVSARFKQRAGAVLRILGLVFLPPVFVGLAEFFGDLAQAPDAPKGWLYAKWAMLCCVVLVPPATFFLGRWILQRGRLERAFDVGLRTLRHILSPKGTGDPRLPTYRMTVFIRTKEKDAIALAPTFRMTSEPDGALLHHGDAGFENTEAFQPGQPFVGLAYSEGRDIYEQLRALEDFNVDLGLSGNDAHEARRQKWLEQWRAYGAPVDKKRSEYMRHVRTVWVFGVPGEGAELLAIISVDSILSDAFPNPKPAGGLLNVELRDAVVAAVASTVRVVLQRSVAGDLKKLIRPSPKAASTQTPPAATPRPGPAPP